MVKGINKRVVVVRPQEKGLFEEVLFIVRGDAFGERGCSAEDIIREASRAAEAYMKNGSGTRRRTSRIPAPIFAVAGAAVTAIIWIMTSLF